MSSPANQPVPPNDEFFILVWRGLPATSNSYLGIPGLVVVLNYKLARALTGHYLPVTRDDGSPIPNARYSVRSVTAEQVYDLCEEFNLPGIYGLPVGASDFTYIPVEVVA